jgi:pimeloyl-ACP methyl ester carboxylesterase
MLAKDFGVLEPLQRALTLPGQIAELADVLRRAADLPVTLIGYSWGAWLGFMLSAKTPSLVKKLIMVSSGPFEARYAADILKTRLSRLRSRERTELKLAVRNLSAAVPAAGDAALAKVGALCAKADAFDPVPEPDDHSDTNTITCQADVFRAVWQEASEWRESGRLVELGRSIQCPVVAIHGDYDPHPAEGVRKPLSGVLEDFRLIKLKKCGHTPWTEQQARDTFFRILKTELKISTTEKSSTQQDHCTSRIHVTCQ